MALECDVALFVSSGVNVKDYDFVESGGLLEVVHATQRRWLATLIVARWNGSR